MKLTNSTDVMSLLKKEVYDDDVKIEAFGTIPTGLITLDKTLGGGVPIGGVTEISGLEGTGKSTLGAMIMAEAQKLEYTSVYLDTECAMSEERLKGIGVNVDNYIYSQPNCLEDVYFKVVRTIDKCVQARIDNPICMVFDSLAATPSKKEIELMGEVEDFDPQKIVGLNARINSAAFRKIMNPISHTKVALVVINQMRENINAGPFSQKYTTPGGKALRFAAIQRIEMSIVGKYEIDKSELDQDARKISFYTAKNKIHRPLLETIAVFSLKTGLFDVNLSVFEHLRLKKILNSSGPSWVLKLDTDELRFKKTEWAEIYETNKAKINEIV